MAVHRVVQTCFDSHIPKVRATYRARRDAMLAVLDLHMPEGVQLTRPEGACSSG